MVAWRTSVLAFFVVVFKCSAWADYAIPPVEFQALKGGGFRVALKDIPGTKQFKFYANINKDLTSSQAGEITAVVSTPTNGYFVKLFDNTLKPGDIVHYRVGTHHERLGYQKDGLSWMVKESDIVDAYSVLQGTCERASTVVNGEQKTCPGQLFLSDDFDGSSVDTAKWIVEHRIPYLDTDLYLNTYENREDTRFVKDGTLYLKPIAINDENEVRRTLDLTNGCTSKLSNQCILKPAGAYLLPPVKSGKITSTIPFQYGKIEIKAKLPAGEWIVPVIELELADKVDGVFSPKVVIAYSRGNDRLTGPSGDIGSRQLYAGPILNLEQPKRSEKLVKKTSQNNSPYSNDFHTYGLEWLPGKMTFFIDSQAYGSVDTSQDSSFNKECRLTLGVAVGGIDFPDGYRSGNNERPWDHDDPFYVRAFFNSRNVWLSTWSGDSTALQIDYVKVWSV